MSQWTGLAVSVRCVAPLGSYQGSIVRADGATITLTKPFRNGFPYPEAQVTLNAADIKELKIIEKVVEAAEPAQSTVPVTGKKAHRATVCENLQASSATGGGVSARSPAARTKPIDIQPRAKNNSHSGSYGNSGSTPKARSAGGGAGGGEGRGEAARRRNEACFGVDVDPDDEFDFEGNLALFDKRALWESMRARPDVLPRTDKLRPDQSVLRAQPAPPPAVRVPSALAAPALYRADCGAPVPAVTPAARRALWRALVAAGLAPAARVLLARAAADLCLRLAGGGRRLEARNAHQAPRAVVLCGAHAAGAAGLLAARLLAAAGARAAALVPAGECAALRAELAACEGAVSLARSPGELPAPDVVLSALHEPAEGGAGAGEGEEGAAWRWARSARAAVVALEPAAGGAGGARAALLALAPVQLAADAGRLYLVNVAPPPRLYSDLGITFQLPFGAASLLPLHPAD